MRHIIQLTLVPSDAWARPTHHHPENHSSRLSIALKIQILPRIKYNVWCLSLTHTARSQFFSTVCCVCAHSHNVVTVTIKTKHQTNPNHYLSLLYLPFFFRRLEGRDGWMVICFLLPSCYAQHLVIVICKWEIDSFGEAGRAFVPSVCCRYERGSSMMRFDGTWTWVEQKSPALRT